MKTLGIETSCDETAIAVYDSKNGLEGESVFSQIDLHASYGGVVPELASRDHCQKIITVLEEATSKIDLESIDQIAYTAGPGLTGALLIGENFAQGLSFSLGVPLIPVNHLEGHLMATKIEFPNIGYPFLCLLVSGGHSMIIDVKDFESYSLLGQSVDDAIGEAFDKVGKLLGLPYPGGPHIEKLALKGSKNKYNFPRPMLNSGDLNLSFSGLKTAVLYQVQKIQDLNDEAKADIAASFQNAAIEILVAKIKQAIIQTGHKSIVISGGVAANNALRNEIKSLEDEFNCSVFYPSMKHCTDNAAMIAYLGSLKSVDKNQIKKSCVRARWPLTEV